MPSRAHLSEAKKLWYLKTIHIFAGLSWKEMRELHRITHMTAYEKNQPIYLPGDASHLVYVLKKGRVKLSKIHEDGREVTIAILEPGEIFGEVEALDRVPRESLVQALDSVLVCEMRREDFERYVFRYPHVGGRVMKLLGGRLRKIETRVADLVFKSAPARLAALLLDLSTTMGISDRDGTVRLPCRLTHQNLANLIGTSRETVSTLMGQFAQQGFIAQERRFLRILDRECLARVK